MLITSGISLYSTRLVLDALGVDDYGIYDLIAGVIIMLSFLNAAMAVSMQRYLSFYQGRKDKKMQRKIFGNGLLIHILIGIGIVLLLEGVGLFLFDGFLNINAERIETAKIIYHFMSASVFFTVISVPFTASLNAHENMLWIAVVGVAEAFLKLGAAIVLLNVTGDRLIYYAIFIVIITILGLVLYAGYCIIKYQECSLSFKGVVDRKIQKELFSFAGWNLFGAACGIGKTQGVAIILNLFLGTAVNAAYGIANQVAAQMSFFSATMLRALNPQIMKSEGTGDRKRMLRLAMTASKFGFFLLAIVAIPCIFEMPAILAFWLKEVPEHTVAFCSLILIGILSNQLTIGLQSAFQATGRIKAYQSVVGSLLLFNLPISFVLLKFNLPAYSVLISFIFIELVACAVRITMLKKQIDMSIQEYCNRVFLKELIPLLVSISVCWVVVSFLEFDFRFIITIFVSIIFFLFSIYLVGLSFDEKIIVDKTLKRLKLYLTRQ